MYGRYLFNWRLILWKAMLVHTPQAIFNSSNLKEISPFIKPLDSAHRLVCISFCAISLVRVSGFPCFITNGFSMMEKKNLPLILISGYIGYCLRDLKLFHDFELDFWWWIEAN
jgi:hypothetical protein